MRRSGPGTPRHAAPGPDAPPGAAAGGMRGGDAGALAILVLMGIGWGLSQPLSKIAVATGLGPFGLQVWQYVATVLLLGVLNGLRRQGLPLGPAALWRYLFVALAGTVAPGALQYMVIAHIPSGMVSVLVSLVPIFALPMAVALGMERLAPRRALGILMGAGAVLLIAGPEAALPEPGQRLWALAGVLPPLLYAIEGIGIARWGRGGLDPLQLLLGSTLAGLVMVVPLALALGQWFDPLARIGAEPAQMMAVAGLALINVVVYSTYLWLVGRTGPVFASQVSYLVTLAGVMWAMLVLGERYTGWFWSALLLMMAGLFLVRPVQAGARRMKGGAAA